MEQLLDRTAGEVHVLDDLSRGRREWLAPEVVFHEVDLRDAEPVRQAVTGVQADAVLHLAALHFIPAVDGAREVNVDGTRNLLDALSLVPPRILVFASTAAVYGDGSGPLPENALVAPVDLYGETKATGERHVAEFAARSGAVPVVARLFNVIGERETNPHVVPELVRQLRTGAATVRLGNLHTRRDYTDAVDVADALVRLLNVDREGAVFNIGSGRGVSVADLVSACEEILGREIRVDVDAARVRAHDRKALIADITRLRSATGWTPSRTLRDTLRRLLLGSPRAR